MFPETAFGFVFLPSVRLWVRQEVLSSPCDPDGIFSATREPSNGTQRCSGRKPLVPMMKPADLWKRHDLSAAAGLNRSPVGGVFSQRKMRSGSVIIIEVRNKNPSQMPFIQDDHVVQAFAPHAADQAFHVRILPRASWCRDDLFHAHRHHRRAERLPVCPVPVANQIPRCRIPRKGFAYLLSHPIRAGMCGDAEMLDVPPLMTQHDEDEQNGERGCRDHKEIDRNETAHVVVEERPPGLRRRFRMPYHVSRYSRLADIDAQLQ